MMHNAIHYGEDPNSVAQANFEHLKLRRANNKLSNDLVWEGNIYTNYPPMQIKFFRPHMARWMHSIMAQFM